MTGAILQGAPGTTLDIDFWIDLPPREYIRVLNLARRLGAEIVANTVAVLPGHTTVNFLYEMSGLNTFATELKRSRQLDFANRKVPVLPLERIHASKKAAGRPKDLAQLPLLKKTMMLNTRRRHKPRPS